MTNWSGTKTNNNPTGTSTGFNTALSLNDTAASWPDLSNWEVRITGGLGVGQVRLIASNTAITIVISDPWLVIPDDTSTYEIVLVLRDQDHIVGNLILGDGVPCELIDSATILIDGNYYIHCQDACEIRWGKTKSTLVTFRPNQAEIQGKAGFWTYIYLQASLTNTVHFSYIRIESSTYGLLPYASIGIGDGSTIHHVWTKYLTLHFLYRSAAEDAQDFKITHLLNEGSEVGCSLNFNGFVNTPFKEEYERIWSERCRSGGIVWASLNSAKIQVVKNAVFKDSWSTSATNIRGDADKRIFLIDSYFSTYAQNAYYLKGTNADANGEAHASRNVSTLTMEVNSVYAYPLALLSRFNDYVTRPNKVGHHYAFYISAASIATSDNDYICGRLSAMPENVDLSEAMSSTENPMQYTGLTSARTNAKATRNKLLECDNVQTSNLTSSSVDVSFDCKNSHAGTTVDQDSASSQKILYLADTTEFEEHETIEIAFGTARAEEGVVASIQAGVSVTLRDNLGYAHTAAQADVVKKQLRNFGLPFIKYGLASGIYDNETPVPSEDKWGAIFCDFETDFYGRTFDWKKHGHSIPLEDLTGNTKYYARVFAYTPLGDLMIGPEFDFTTLPLADYTDPGESNVRDSITYKFAGFDKLGVLDLPVMADVRFGVSYDDDTKIGVLNLPVVGDVRDGILYDDDTKEGVLNLPVVGDVRDGILYDDDTKEGVLDLPFEEDVLEGISYDNDTKTGTLVVSAFTDAMGLSAADNGVDATFSIWVSRNGAPRTDLDSIAAKIRDDTGALIVDLGTDSTPTAEGVFTFTTVSTNIETNKAYTLVAVATKGIETWNIMGGFARR